MAILAPIFAFVGKQIGRIVTTALGWASILLFGRVPQSRQLILAFMTLGYLTWVAMLLGVLIPDVGTFLLGFIPVPDFIDETWIRLAMLAGAIVVPLLIGLGGLLIPDAPQRPKGLDAVKLVLRGYPLAFLLAFTLLFLAVVGAIRKGRTLIKRWSDAHVPIVVKPGGYQQMVSDLEEALDQAGLEVAERPAPSILSLPARLVARVAGGGIRAFVPDRLTLLVAPDLEISLYPSDIAIAGKKLAVARARAAIASRLTASSVYLTTTKESQIIEDRLTALAQTTPARDGLGRPVLDETIRKELAAIDDALARLDVDYDEWEVLYRMRLQVERDLLNGASVGQAFPGATEPVVAGGQPTLRPASAFAVLGLGLIALDVALALLERFRPVDRR